MRESEGALIPFRQEAPFRGRVASRPRNGVCNRWPARIPRRAVAGPALQVRFPTSLTDEEYVRQRAWNDATAPACPWCPAGTCELAPHGFYRRVKPRGALIRRYLCRRVRRTVSLLPDCFAAHVTGSLEEVEAAVRVSSGAASRAAAVERARPPPQGSLASAERWLERRVEWVAVLLVTVKGLCPERFTGVAPTLAGFGQQLGSDTVLRELREVAEQYLQDLPAPVGFRYRGGVSVGASTAAAEAETQFTGLSPPGRGA